MSQIQISDQDVARQAVAALRGYAYQLWASARAWADLKESEQILLEVAEDYSVVAADALQLSQVKDTPSAGSVTLRDRGAVKAINALWRFQGLNSDRVVSLRFMTTSMPGVESGAPFGRGKAGIVSWREGAREGADLQPLRSVLGTLDLDADLQSWLAEADDDQIRNRLLRRIHWDIGAPPLAGLDRLLGERLVNICHSQGVPPSLAESGVRDAVLMHVLRKVGEGRAEDRSLGRAELLEVIERASSISLPIGTIRRQTRSNFSGFSTSVFEFVETFSRAGSSVLRPVPITVLISRCARGPAWLYGASGTGKTALALDVARESSRNWCLLDLRGLNGKDAAARIRAGRHELPHTENPGGVILDDLEPGASLAIKGELRLLTRLLAELDAGLLVLSSRAPALSLQSAIEIAQESIVAAPYFNQDEVATLIAEAGGDPAIWARTIWLLCGRGFPQLVAARVVGLSVRGWPASAMLNGLASEGWPTEVVSERETVRARLVDELPAPARSLLYRLSVLSGPFDRALAIALGRTGVQISEPGAALDLLIGPWIESRDRDRMRLSPLVIGAGANVLGVDERCAANSAVVEELIRRPTLEVDQLPQVLASSLACGHADGLEFVAFSALSFEADREILRSVFRLLAMLRYDRPIFPEDRTVNRKLRLAQVRILSLGTEGPPIEAAFARLVDELHGVPEANMIRAMAAYFVLTSDEAYIRPSHWFAYLRDVDLAPSLKEGSEMDPGVAVFTMRAVNLRSMKDLEELFATLNGLDASLRARYLGGFSRGGSNRRLLLNVGWLTPSRSPGFDGRSTANRYVKLREIAEWWHDQELALECACTQAILLTEYAEAPEEALEVLRLAEVNWPEHPRIRREQAKILFILGRHPAVAAMKKELLAGIDPFDRVELANVARELAASAGATGDLAEAADLFSLASTTASGSMHMHGMALGLSADRAFVVWRQGNRQSGLQILRDAILAAEELDHSTPHIGQIARGLSIAARFMFQDVDAPGWENSFPKTIFGSASRAATAQAEDKGLSLLTAWYQLEAVEQLVGADVGARHYLEERTKERKIPIFELIRISRDYLAILEGDDPIAVVGGLSAFSLQAAYSVGTSITEPETLGTEAVSTLPWDGPFNYNDHRQRRFGTEALLVSCAFAVIRGDESWPDRLRAAAPEDAETTRLVLEIPSMSEKLNSNSGGHVHAVNGAFRVLQEEQPNAVELFFATLRVWEWLGGTIAARRLTRLLGPKIEARWRFVATEARFALRAPSVTAPAILDACVQLGDRAQLSRLLLAAQSALKVTVPADMMQEIVRCASTTVLDLH